ncbi:alpha/beta hydrolase [Novosphingobium sp. EMRT-2]|uniref:alpha/beta hydrolase n=1 Tax=Novosphingobium sp. EMRT-2 TaxID=2571749 RepID=UPI002102B12B|nr:alpha/beta hydrolase [Novosphingobium sp. EMRT-2]
MDFTRRTFGIAALGAAAAPAMLTAGAGQAVARSGIASTDSDGLAMVDPELREGAKLILSRPLPDPLDHKAILGMRAKAPPPPAALPSPAPAVELRRVPGAQGQPDVGVAVIGARRDGVLRPAVLHIHGGGFIVGRMEDTFPASQALAEELDCVVVEVDYRLSPETRFPGPLEDCHAALVWLHGNAEELGVDRDRIAIKGESAGGGLAAMLAIAARDRASVPLCFQVLIYPMLDDRTGSTRHVPPFIGTIGWNEAGNVVGWTSLLGQPAGMASVPPGAVPARVENLAGLPPAFIGVGAIDLFVDEDIAYAQALIRQGVPTQMLVVPGAYHGFDFIAPASRAARTFTASWKLALGAAFLKASGDRPGT